MAEQVFELSSTRIDLNGTYSIVFQWSETSALKHFSMANSMSTCTIHGSNVKPLSEHKRLTKSRNLAYVASDIDDKRAKIRGT